MITAEKAREIMEQVKENAKQEREKKAVEFCEGLSDLIEERAKAQRKYLEIEEFDDSLYDNIKAILESNGFRVWSDAFGRLVIAW